MTPECQSTLEKLSDPAAVLSPESLAHLSSCRDCREAHAVLQALERTRLEPDERTLTGFAARLAVAGGGPRPRRTSLWAGALAAAGATALALFGLVRAPAPPDPNAAARVEAFEPFEELSLSAELAEYLFDDLAWDEEALLAGSLGSELDRLDELLDFGDEGSS
ncbi:MAG TPA: hypothetical protein DFS52_03000 [Myxococcales bacterium]|nr:hypothetical protein [Myxococcales bacterium]